MLSFRDIGLTLSDVRFPQHSRQKGCSNNANKADINGRAGTAHIATCVLLTGDNTRLTKPDYRLSMRIRALTLSGLTAMVAAIFAMSGASTCGCEDPMPEAEFQALIKLADRGNLEAIGHVWYEYEYKREDRKNGAVWARRVIDAGAPKALENMALHWLWQAQAAPTLREKKIFANAARAVLERGYQNRHRIPTKGDPEYNPAVSFAHTLRTARAVNTMLNDSLAPWLAKAQKNEPVAVYNIVTYYSWIKLDQKKRRYWETRASELGDPTFAGDVLNYDRSPTQKLRDIDKALRSPDILARSGGKWMQSRFVEDLVERKAMIREQARLAQSK